MSVNPLEILQSELCQFAQEIRRLKAALAAKDAAIAQWKDLADHNAVDFLAEMSHKDHDRIIELQKEIAELRRTSGEPVAWMIIHHGCVSGVVETLESVALAKGVREGVKEIKPLYAAPPPLELPSEELMVQTLESLDSIYGKGSYARKANAVIELLKR